MKVRPTFALFCALQTGSAYAGSSYLQEFDDQDEFNMAVLPSGWTHSFASSPDCARPVFGDNMSARRVKPNGWRDATVGGDYLRAPYPIGISTGANRQWWGSRDERPSPSSPWGGQPVSCVGSIASPNYLSSSYSAPDAIVIGPEPDRRYISFLIGGVPAGGNVSITWVPPCTPGQVNGGGCPFPVSQTLRVREYASIAEAPLGNEALPPPSVPTKLAIAYPDRQQMRQVIWDTWAMECAPNFYMCKPASGTVVSIRVEAAVGGINIDRIMVSDRDGLLPAPYGAVGPDLEMPAPVWGFADLHTHWMNHLSNGAIPFHESNAGGEWSDPEESLKVVLPHLWGRPWASGTTESSQLEAAIPSCGRQGHGGTNSSGAYVHRTHAGANGLLSAMNSQDGSEESNLRHGDNGHTGSTYNLTPFPFFTRTLQQMFYTWVKRARDGGLRLIVSDVLWSGAAEILLSNWVTPLRNTYATDPDYNGTNGGGGPFITASTDFRAAYGYSRDARSHTEGQVCATLKFMDQPQISDFAQVAFTPQQARDIISMGKLAVVIGSELDNHGQLRGFSDLREEVAWMRGLGVRKFTPVHLVDNAVGGAAVYSELFSIYNDAMDFRNNMVGGQCLRSDDPAGHLSSSDVWERRHFKWLAYEPGDISSGTVDGSPSGVPEGTLRCQLTWDRLNHNHYGCPEGGCGTDLHEDSDGDGIMNVFDPDWTGDTNFDGVVDNWSNVKHTPSNYFDIEEGCPAGTTPGDGECIDYKLFERQCPPLLPSSLPKGCGAASAGVLDAQHRCVYDVAGCGTHYRSSYYVSDPPQRAVINETDLIVTQYGLRVNLESDFDLTNIGRWANYTSSPSSPAFLNGHRNARGLEGLGINYVQELMRHGLIIDVTHASDKTVGAIVGGGTNTGLIWDFAAGCHTSVWTPGCQDSAYPVVATHGSFRRLRMDKARERDLSDSQFARIIASGGTVGIGASFDEGGSLAVASSGAPSDCRGSSKNFAQNFAHALDMLEGFASSGPLRSAYGTLPDYWGLRGVGLGTDLNGFEAQTGPRFGNAGCQRYAHGNTERDAQRTAQNAIRYTIDAHPGSGSDESNTYWMPAGESTAMQLMQIDNGSAPLPVELVGNILWKITYNGFDFNELGLVNYGLVPDFLQDVVNGAYNASTGVDNRPAVRERMRFLYRSAEDFIQAWERSVTNCSARTSATPADCAPPESSSLNATSCNVWVNMESVIGPAVASASAALTSTNTTLSCAGRCDESLICDGAGCCSCSPDCAADGTCCSDFSAACAGSISCAGNCSLDCADDPFAPCCNDYETACLPSCGASCGGYSNNGVSGCWCDSACTQAGDCCADFQSACDPWSGSCGSGTCDAVGDNNLCRCDSSCPGDGDCCNDYVEVCHPPPPDRGSCYNDCGTISSDGGCFCDPICETYGDCCWDREIWCPGGAPSTTGSCDGMCGGPGDTGTCFCDAACETFGDCCDNYKGFCKMPSCDEALGSAWPVSCDSRLNNQYGNCACDAAPNSGCDLRGDCCPDAFAACGI